MKLEKIAEIYHGKINGTTPSGNVFLAVSMYEKELSAKEKAESALLTALTPKQRKLFEAYKDVWTELDTIVELEAFRQGILTAEKQKSGHSLKIESGR